MVALPVRQGRSVDSHASCKVFARLTTYGNQSQCPRYHQIHTTPRRQRLTPRMPVPLPTNFNMSFCRRTSTGSCSLTHQVDARLFRRILRVPHLQSRPFPMRPRRECGKWGQAAHQPLVSRSAGRGRFVGRSLELFVSAGVEELSRACIIEDSSRVWPLLPRSGRRSFLPILPAPRWRQTGGYLIGGRMAQAKWAWRNAGWTGSDPAGRVVVGKAFREEVHHGNALSGDKDGRFGVDKGVEIVSRSKTVRELAGYILRCQSGVELELHRQIAGTL